MTRSITIVNTSNWDGENYAVEVPHTEAPVLIRPGESVRFTPTRAATDEGGLSPTCWPIQLDALEGKTPTPFEIDTVEAVEQWPKTGERKRKQAFPQVRVTIE